MNWQEHEKRDQSQSFSDNGLHVNKKNVQETKRSLVVDYQAQLEIPEGPSQIRTRRTMARHLFRR